MSDSDGCGDAAGLDGVAASGDGSGSEPGVHPFARPDHRQPVVNGAPVSDQSHEFVIGKEVVCR